VELLAAGHIHSEWSYDGSFGLARLAEMFTARGYRILLMTEHDRNFSPMRFKEFKNACSTASSSRILLVPGIEYSDPDNRVHVLTWGLNDFLGENLPTSALLSKVRAAGGIAVLAHPSRKAVWSIFEPTWTENLWGIEVWNRKYDGWAPSTSAPTLLKAPHLVRFVGLDFHTSRQHFPLSMALSIEGEISETAVLHCLRERRCQARALGQNLSIDPALLPQKALRIAERGRRAARTLWRSFRSIPKKASSHV
jgi:hypothetical protein